MLYSWCVSNGSDIAILLLIGLQLLACVLDFKDHLTKLTTLSINERLNYLHCKRKKTRALKQLTQGVQRHHPHFVGSIHDTRPTQLGGSCAC